MKVFDVVQRTWDPESIPGRRHLGAVRMETVATCPTLGEAEAAAKARAAAYAAHGYNRQRGYWWGRDDRFRYTFVVEAR